MTVCVDTNVLLQARASKHPFAVILDGIMVGSIKWELSHRVLSEYCEIVNNRAGPSA
jgi:predicted nucleic acid-binding protein